MPVEESHTEVDNSPLLGLYEHRQYQMLIGMLNQLVTIGKPELSTACASLNCLDASPHQQLLEPLLRAFGYVKTVKDKKIAIDSGDMIFECISPDYEKLRPDFLRDYPDTKEELDPHFPDPYGLILQQTLLVDSDHAHNLVTHKSIIGLLGLVGSTLSFWSSKWQNTILLSTYAAEYYALHVTTEEAISVQYML